MIAVIDSNVLVRVLNPDDELHADVKDAIPILASRGFEFRLTFQIVAEYWSVCTRPKSSRRGLGLASAEVSERLDRVLERWPLLSESDNTFSVWRDLVVTTKSRGRQVHDARIAATLKANGIQHLVSLTVRTSTGILSLPF